MNFPKLACLSTDFNDFHNFAAATKQSSALQLIYHRRLAVLDSCFCSSFGANDANPQLKKGLQDSGLQAVTVWPRTPL